MSQTETNHDGGVDTEWTESRDRVNVMAAAAIRRHTAVIDTLTSLLHETIKNKEDLMLLNIAIRVARTEDEADRCIRNVHAFRFSNRFASFEGRIRIDHRGNRGHAETWCDASCRDMVRVEPWCV